MNLALSSFSGNAQPARVSAPTSQKDCGANIDTASTGILVLVIPTSYFIGRPQHSYVNLIAEDHVTSSDGTVSFWDTGLYLPDVTPNASAIGALDPPAKAKEKK